MSRIVTNAVRRVGVIQIGDADQLVADLGDGFLPLAALLGSRSPSSMQELITGWETFKEAIATAEPDSATGTLSPWDSPHWRAPIIPSKLICVGANYVDHVVEMAGAGGPQINRTAFPFSFLKPPSTAVVGGETPVAIPAYGHKLDWEAELAVVIGDPHNAVSDPAGAIFGYTIVNDLSLRDFVPFPHALGLDAVISKGFDGAAPTGPWITLASEVPDPGSLTIDLWVNGESKQHSSTEQMIFSVHELVAYYARVLTLEPGDVIATGTPAGVGAGKQPPQFLTAGDVIEIRIGDLGLLKTPIVAATNTHNLAIDAGTVAN
jgi:2,4-diketo-3-deoxy-L-fuconate hydrolase